jgi:two-component system, OmpR family, phosphate regulon response regulator PhoB
MGLKEEGRVKKILVVDDVEEVRDLVEKTLRRTDRQVFKAENGEKGVEMAIAEGPDLVMMDVMMPGAIDGLEATRMLKKHPRTKACKVILLTAKGQTVDREKGTEAGADDYIVKPFSPLELMKKVDKILD